MNGFLRHRFRQNTAKTSECIDNPPFLTDTFQLVLKGIEMTATLYEQFLAVGSVKSLLTGKEIPVSQSEPENTSDTQQKSSSHTQNAASHQH